VGTTPREPSTIVALRERAAIVAKRERGAEAGGRPGRRPAGAFAFSKFWHLSGCCQHLLCVSFFYSRSSRPSDAVLFIGFTLLRIFTDPIQTKRR
jgi:hypothetical protein